MNFLDSIWMIPLFPLAGAIMMWLFGRRLDPQPPSDVAVAEGVMDQPDDPDDHHAHAGHAHDAHGHDDHGHDGHGHHEFASTRKIISLICPGMILVSLIFAIGAVSQLASQHLEHHEVILYSWMAGLPFHTAGGMLGRFGADMGFLLDPLSSVMILVITFIGFLIHVYSTGYMGHESGYYRFFAYLNLFVFFMLVLVLANNYLLLFVGWEGVGLCSYLLIGFYFHKKSAGDAGKKAFIVNRVGDASFILGMLLMFSMFGSVQFLHVNAALEGLTAETTGFGVLSVMALLLFIGATGKSAQVPLYIWLPDAMEGPTPVSALIHAATMVTAGVYMVARSNALYALAPHALAIVAVIGALTAILAASIALVQTDIKRVLAYSTVSQLGYMFVAAGVGAYWVAVFHLFTHAFFKALLFLGSGSVIHAMSGEQDMRQMGGLKDKIPITHWTMFIASLAIAGIPGFSGFFSKDEILWQAWSSPYGSTALWAVGTVTAFMTAFYMWRLMYMTFYGEPRMDEATKSHIHESPKSMTVPLAVLAAGSALGGWIGVPVLWSWFGDAFRLFEHWLEPVFEPAAVQAAMLAVEGPENHATEWALMGLSVLLAVSGILLARYLYVTRPEAADSIEQATGPMHRILLNKWYVDEIYNYLIVDGLCKGGGRVLAGVDQKVVDGGVNGAGWLTRFTSRVSGWWDTWIVDGTVRGLSFAVRISSYPARIAQSGYLQSYAFVIVVGVACALGYFLLHG